MGERGPGGDGPSPAPLSLPHAPDQYDRYRWEVADATTILESPGDRPEAQPLAPSCRPPDRGARRTYRRRAMTYPSPPRRGLPGHGRPRAVPHASDHDRSRARHTRAPGHERPPVAHSRAAGHDRPRATPQAPGHDVPLATAAGAPGHGRPCAAQLVPDHYWSHHAPMAPPGSRTGARRHVCAYRHHSLAGPREPTAPGSLAPRPCHSQHPHLPAIPPKRREPPRPALPRSHLLAIPLHHPSSASTHHGSNRGASFTTDRRQRASRHPCHRLLPPPPLPRPAAARPRATTSAASACNPASIRGRAKEGARE